MKDKYARKNLMEMDPDLLRAIIRERTHHTLELQVYRILSGSEDIRDTLGNRVQSLMDIWKERGLPMDLPDLKWTLRLLVIAEDLKRGKKPTLGTELIKPFSKDELHAVEKAIFTRRSIRKWKQDDVPEWMVKKLVEAAQWAPSSCNTQTVRIKIIKDKEGLSLVFGDYNIKGAEIMFVFCQDMRPYEFYGGQIPTDNRNFDCGAAVQNMLLMAHALGLGAIWMTFSEKEKENIRKRYNIPQHYKISTYVALGWPDESPLAPGRIKPEEATI